MVATWGAAALIHEGLFFKDSGEDARGIHPGKFGAQYGRMTRLADGSWLVVYTIYDNDGYRNGDLAGLAWHGTALQVARSMDRCRTWKVVSTIRGDNRDLDNGEIIQLPNHELLIAFRSVRWQQSYQIRVCRSADGGATWQQLSKVDCNEGYPRSLGNPDKGVYEPDFCLLQDGSLALFYANEKHVTETPAYSQVISEKISTDDGRTWGNEAWVAWDPAEPGERPGMPVVTRMANGRYIIVFEVVGRGHQPGICHKSSPDGRTWAPGLGEPIAGQAGGPYVTLLDQGALALTSNTGNVSFSEDDGETWQLDESLAWGDGALGRFWWLSIYQTGPDEIGVVASTPRSGGGTAVQIRFGKISRSFPHETLAGGHS